VKSTLKKKILCVREKKDKKRGSRVKEKGKPAGSEADRRRKTERLGTS